MFNLLRGRQAVSFSIPVGIRFRSNFDFYFAAQNCFAFYSALVRIVKIAVKEQGCIFIDRNEFRIIAGSDPLVEIWLVDFYICQFAPVGRRHHDKRFAPFCAAVVKRRLNIHSRAGVAKQDDTALKLAQARLCPPMVEQIAATAALTAPASYVEEVREMYEKRRNTLIKAMQRIPGVRCSMPKGAFYFVADLPVDDAESFALFMLRDFNYEGNTVMFAPAEDFYVTKGLGHSQARFAYVIDEKELEMAAKCLEEGLKAYRKTVMHIE